MKNPLIARYAKFITAAAGSIAIVAVELAADGSLGKWGPVVIALGAAIGVKQIPNAPKYN